MRITIEGAERVAMELGEMPERATRAMVRAMNRAIASGRTVMVREVARDTGLTQAVVRAAMRMQEATWGRPIAELAASLRPLSLSKFGARQTTRGVTANLGPGGGGRKVYPNAFLATMRSGHTGVFERQLPSTRKSPGAWGKNLPIGEKHGPSIGHVFRKYRPLGISRVEEQFEKEFDHELKVRGGGGA